MRPLVASDFESLAKTAVDRFLSKSGSLDDILTKTAVNQELNPEQTRTLVQAANVLAHLALMDQKPDGDKYVDFAPTDPNVVVKKIFVISSGDGSGETGENTGTGTGEEGCPICGRSETERLADFQGDPPNAETPIRQLEEKKPDGQGEYKLAEEKKLTAREVIASVRTTKKTIEELETVKQAAALEYSDTLDGLVMAIRRSGDPLAVARLEKNAAAVYGVIGEDIVARVRDLAYLPGGHLKLAESTAPNTVADTEHPHMLSLYNMVKAAERHDEAQQAIDFLRAKIAGLEHVA